MKTVEHRRIGTAALLCLAAALVLGFAWTVRQAALRQSVAIFSLLAGQGPEAAPTVNRLFSELSTETAYAAGLEVLRQSGYGEAYRSLLTAQLRSDTAVFCLLLAVLAAAALLLDRILDRRSRRETGRLADWLNAEDGPMPRVHGLPAELDHAMRELKQKLVRRQEIHETDNRKILQYMEDISHQLKTPLTVIRVACERTALRLPEAEAAMATCRTQVDRMADMIRKLLQLGRFDCGQAGMRFEPVSIAGLIETVTNDLAPLAAAKGLAFRVAGQSEQPWLCDPFWMQEALGNLLKNCIEHAENGVVSIDYRSGDAWQEIRIRDSGVGFADGYESRVFARYAFGDRRSKESHGLGLAIAAEVLRLHFGTIQAGNRPEGGAEFRLSFPRLEKNAVYGEACHVPVR